MLSLAKGFGRSASAGRPLPEVYRTFGAAGAVFRTSATSMVAGAPGSYKSALALNLLTAWARRGVHGLYFSADADEFTVSKRCAAILTRQAVDDCERGLRNPATSPYYARALGQLEHVRWVYKPVDIDGVDRHLRAFEAVYGSFPRVVVIDNLLNMSDASEDWTAAREMLRNLDIMAREAVAHILVLHHTTESFYTPGLPPPRSAILGKLSQFPRLILTVGAHEETLNVAVVKNTNGPQSATGREFFPMRVDPSRMTISDTGFCDERGLAG